jgi:tetratricopeptide (TPR) repeat protein
LRLHHEKVEPAGIMSLFPEDSIGEPQRPWAEMLASGRFAPAKNAATGYQADDFWAGRLGEALRDPHTDAAAAWFHLGVAKHGAGDRESARAAWQASAGIEPTAVASFALGTLAEEESGPQAAVHHYRQATALAPDSAPLALAYANCLLLAGDCAAVVAFVDGHPTLRFHPRLQLVRHQARLRQDALDEVEAWLLGHPVLPDMREGEQVLTDLWDELQTLRGTSRPAPPEIDFRMRRIPSLPPT